MWCEKNKWDGLGSSNSWRLLLVNIFANKSTIHNLGGNVIYFISNNDQKTQFLAFEIYNIQHRPIKVGFRL